MTWLELVACPAWGSFYQCKLGKRSLDQREKRGWFFFVLVKRFDNYWAVFGLSMFTSRTDTKHKDHFATNISPIP